MKKQLAVLAIVFLLLIPTSGLFAAAQEEMAAEKMTFTWLGGGWNEEIVDDSWAEQQIQDMFDVEIIPVNILRSETDKLTLLVASGDFPDVAYWSASDRYGLYADGVTRSIPESAFRQYAPEYTRRLDQDFPWGWNYNLVPGMDDEYFSTTMWCVVCGGGIDYAPQFRMDWLEKIGMVPDGAFDMFPEASSVIDYKSETADARGKYHFYPSHPTLDWYEGVLRGFLNNDPDGNGKNDSIPLMLYGHWASHRGLMEMFGISYGRNLMEDGELIQALISKNYRDYLNLLAGWYAEGLIDPEFVLLKGRGDAEEKFRSGVAGTFMMHYIYLTYYYKRWDSLFKNVPSAKVLMTLPIMNRDGRVGAYASDLDSVNSWTNYVVGAHVDDAKLAKFLEIYDWINFDPEQQVYLRYGLPDEHFEWNGDAWASRPRMKEGVEQGGGDQGLMVYPHGYETKELAALHGLPPGAEIVKPVLFDSITDIIIFPLRFDPQNRTDEQEIKKNYGSALKTIEDEYLVKAITGEVDIDSSWDDYVAQWRRAGGDELLAAQAQGLLYGEFMNGNIVY